MKAATILAVLSLMNACAATPALAHGDWDWIRRGEYKGADGAHCCDPVACHPVDPATVKEVPGGFMTPLVFVPGKATYQTEDGRSIVCHPNRSTGTARCLFHRFGG